MKPWLREFLLFGLVGVAGFVADTAVLYLFRDSVGNYWARAISFPCAVFVTWILNRNLTFRSKSSNKAPWLEFVHYFAMMIAGGAVNYLAYAALVTWSPTVRQFPVLGVAAGSLVGMFVNYLQLRLGMYKYDKNAISR
ncbi:GtrA family protein [Advenella kashmirensis]